jgi:diguanylate cyclase (GGDEF)-like protein
VVDVMSILKTCEIAKGIYWVGGSGQDGGLHCNPYLLVDEEEAVLIDPGSVLDFEYVFKNVCNIVPLERIKYVILHHQDPDLCSSVPLFEEKGAKFTIVTHWRTQTLVKYYGIKSPYYLVNEHEHRLLLKSGRVINFVPTPYLHFPGAVASYDSQSQTLFSSDLFGAFSYEWTLYAGDDYMERMKTFHEHYMPSNDILRPVMELMLRMDIAMIAPQHGSIINNNVANYIKALRDLECGAFIMPIKRDLAKSGGYISVCSAVLKRYVSIFNKDEVLEIIKDLDLTLDHETMEITDYNYRGSILWDLLFAQISARKGLQWLFVIEPLVQKLSQEYDIELPEVFKTTFFKVEEQISNLNKENSLLKEINAKLINSINEAQELLIKDSVTGQYNYDFFKNYLVSEIKDLLAEGVQQNPALIIMSLDNAAKIKFSYGDDEIDETLRSIVYIANNIKDENTIIFRLQGNTLAAYLPHTSQEMAVNWAERLRNSISASEKFIENTTVSIGVLCLDELKAQNNYINDPARAFYNIAMLRVRLAKNMGMNIVCSSSSVEHYQEEIAKILIIDTDEVNIDVLQTFLENLQYKVFVAHDGIEALEISEREALDLIISEIMIPKMDGFLVRERLLMQSHAKIIPFIIVSHLKNEDSVKRAAALQVKHYFRKPFMLSELLGVIKNIAKGIMSDEY